MDLSVIIVNHNVKYFLEQCLLSVIKACKKTDAEIIVVDNHSTDGSREYLSPKFPGVIFHWNKTNPGFGKANNSALSQAKGNHILFLNPDTIVPENCFTDCIFFFKSHPDCGALGVRMLDGSGNFLPESKRAYPKPMAGFYKITGLTNLFPRSQMFASYYDTHLAEKETGSTAVLAGAYMMLSKKAIGAAKGFDEDFFMYGEDIDLSCRVLAAGFKNYYLGEISIIHFKGESTQKQSGYYARHFYGAMKLFVDKHYSNFLSRAVFKAAITFGQAAAVAKQKLSSSKINSQPVSVPHILIIGEAVQKETVEKILQSKADYIDPIHEKITAETILNKEEAATINTVVFCEGASITNEQIIGIMEKLPNKFDWLFYENGAQSIIGSSNKNTNGFFAA